jgi:hypothetical protein
MGNLNFSWNNNDSTIYQNLSEGGKCISQKLQQSQIINKSQVLKKAKTNEIQN